MNRGRPQFSKVEELREYKLTHSAPETAKHFGCSKGTVSKYCKGIPPQKASHREGVPNKYRGTVKPQNIIRMIRERCPTFEFAGNYTGSEGYVDIKCKTCGEIIRKSCVAIRHGTAECDNCIRITQEERQRQADIKKQTRETIRQTREQEKRETREKWEQERMHDCPVCGARTYRPKYCSRECLNKAQNALREANRRAKIKEALVDNDISLAKLYQRDRGVCAICGEICNYEDYATKDGHFVAGNTYPSIDHIVPLSKGGSHAWSNIQLAHRRCNTLKSDQIIAP